MSFSKQRPHRQLSPFPGVRPDELPTTPLPVAAPLCAQDIGERQTSLLPATPMPAGMRRSTLPEQDVQTHILPVIALPEGTRPHTLPGSIQQPSAPPALSPRTMVIIRATRTTSVPRVQPASRLLIKLGTVLLMLLVTGLSLLLVSPLGRDLGLQFNAQPGSMLVANRHNDPKLIAQATATAVYHRQTDGFDPYSGGNITITNGSGSLHWPVGQCTYWANYRYHALTGFWVAWTGNADQWVTGAKAAGWTVSQAPHLPSIIVLMPGVQGASSYGHVAVVENLVTAATPPSVHTSNMNWWTDGGGWDKVSSFDFTIGSGVYFVWHS